MGDPVSAFCSENSPSSSVASTASDAQLPVAVLPVAVLPVAVLVSLQALCRRLPRRLQIAASLERLLDADGFSG